MCSATEAVGCGGTPGQYGAASSLTAAPQQSANAIRVAMRRAESFDRLRPAPGAPLPQRHWNRGLLAATRLRGIAPGPIAQELADRARRAAIFSSTHLVSRRLATIV